jgi:spore maturation protein CgeB
MRLYEATGTGALILTDAARGLGDLFAADEVATYDSPDDLVEKARHYLDHDEERMCVARAGQERTLREHTYRARMAELDGFLQARVGAASSPSQSRYVSTIVSSA